MKKEIHPQYIETQVSCGCGNQFTTRSTRERIAVEVCANCHPFFTGKQKFVDTAGMVEKFQKRWAANEAAKAAAAAKAEPKKTLGALAGRAQQSRNQQTIAAQFGGPKQAAPPAPRPAPAPQAVKPAVAPPAVKPEAAKPPVPAAPAPAKKA